MSGLLALHGGGEFQTGDEPFLRALLEQADEARHGNAADRTPSHAPLSVAIVPTASARGRPDLAAGHGIAAIERVASGSGRAVRVRSIAIVDDASASDPDLAAELIEADLIHFPGGDPDLIPTLFRGTAAEAGLRAAHERGAVIAGASAGAMALASLTWTPSGLVRGLGFLPGVIVAPHADAATWVGYLERFAPLVPADVGVLGLGERTGIIGAPTGPWRVVGEGEVRWLPMGVRDPDLTVVRRDRDELRGPGDVGALAG